MKYTLDVEPSVENIVYRNNTSKTETNYGNENKINYGDFENIDLKIICNNILLSLFYSIENLVLEDITSIIEFDMMQSSSPANLVATIN